MLASTTNLLRGMSFFAPFLETCYQFVLCDSHAFHSMLSKHRTEVDYHAQIRTRYLPEQRKQRLSEWMLLAMTAAID